MKKVIPNFGIELFNNFKNITVSLNLEGPFFEEQPSQIIVKPLTLDLFKYRGEKISNRVADLKQLIEYRALRKSGKGVKPKKEKSQITRFKVKSNNEIALNIFKMVIEAPLIAKKAKPGNFIIIMNNLRIMPIFFFNNLSFSFSEFS